MNGLPTRTNGGVRVRSLDRVSEGSAVAARPAPVQTSASAGGRILPLKAPEVPGGTREDRVVTINDLAAGTSGGVPEASPDRAERRRVGRGRCDRLD